MATERTPAAAAAAAAAAIQAAASVLAHLVQEAEGADHFRILVAVDLPDCRLEVTALSKWKLLKEPAETT